jgi:hypothetical protein
VRALSQDPVDCVLTWRDVDRVRGYRGAEHKALVGWYHSHPDFGVFLSETDLEKTHRVLFAEPFQVALVYDPMRGRAGYFFWEGPHIIDSSQAPWREFEIPVSSPGAMVAVPDESTATLEGPAVPAPSPGQPDEKEENGRPV